MTTKPRESTNDGQSISFEIVAKLEADIIHLCHDESFLYAACRDQFVRVWSKKTWELEVELGEIDSIPLSVQVDQDQVYATCEQKVYVWKKDSWGMLGWFDLSYQAVTSILYGDYFYIGSKGGRLVSIQKDTHETSSWQLHKSSVTSIWADDRIICTSTNKGNPRVWMYSRNQAPSELASFEKKDKAGVLYGNDDYIIVGTREGEIRIWDRVEWKVEYTFETNISSSIVNMWANNRYLIAGFSQGSVVIWDFDRSEELGRIELDKSEITWLETDNGLLHFATSEGIVTGKLKLVDRPFDIVSGDEVIRDGLVRTSPYDVLEDILEFQKEGDKYLEKSSYLEAVAEYESALQLLIDNNHALLEVPEEREKLAKELNNRLGMALLKAKISDLDSIIDEISLVADELDEKGQIEHEQDEIEKLWEKASRSIKESRVLSEAQAGNMLSYQLSYKADLLEQELDRGRKQFASYRALVNEALALTYRIESEWKRMERRRTKLSHRIGFLERAMKELETKLQEADEDSEVKKILIVALEKYKKIHEQISRILNASEFKQVEKFVDKEEALAAIEGFLKIFQKKKDELASIDDPDEKEIERDRLITGLRQALETASKFKLKKELKLLTEALENITQDSQENENKS